MFSLWNSAEDVVEFGGVEYRYDGAYDVAIEIIELMEDVSDVSDIDKLEIIMMLLFGEDSDVFDMEIADQILLYKEVLKKHFNNGEELEKRDLDGNVVPPPRVEKAYSFKHDADYIYSAFMQAYHIDLVEERGRLHWEEFVALMNGLPDETQFKKIVQIRTWKKPSKNETQEKQMKKLKKVYALPEMEVD